MQRRPSPPQHGATKAPPTPLAEEATLSDADLTELEIRFGDKTPTHPCPHCGAVDWAVAAMGRGRVSWACSPANESDRTVRSIHYAAAHHETTSGSPAVIALVAEVRRHRAARSVQ